MTNQLIRICLITLLVGGNAGLAATTGIKAGFASLDISPEIGMHEAHAMSRRVFTAFRDPCKVRVVVFDDGERKVALVGLDTLIVPRSIVIEARSKIETVCGIPPSAIMIGASHSHSSGPVGLVMPGQFDRAPADIQRLAYEEESIANPKYLSLLLRQIIEAVRLADANCKPAQIGFGYGHEPTVAFNRRQRMKNGQSWTNGGAMNPDIVGYAGPTDPQVGVMGAWDESGFGLDIKAGTRFPFTFIAELANGCVGYVPPEEAFGPNGGGYETRLTFYSNLEVTAGRQFADTGVALAREMKAGILPEFPRIPAPAKPWPYGSVPPER